MRQAQETKGSPLEKSTDRTIQAWRMPYRDLVAHYADLVKSLNLPSQRGLDGSHSPEKIVGAAAAALRCRDPQGKAEASKLLARFRAEFGMDLWLGSEVWHD